MKAFNASITNSTSDAAPVVTDSRSETALQNVTGVAENRTAGEGGALTQQMAAQFRLVYSARAAFRIQNLSAVEMFQVRTPKSQLPAQRLL